jgi:hypothetical protein
MLLSDWSNQMVANQRELMIISVNLGSYLTSQSKRWMMKTRGPRDGVKDCNIGSMIHNYDVIIT